MILMLTDGDGHHVLINSECISRAFRTKIAYPDTYSTLVIIKERQRSHKKRDGMFSSQIEYTSDEEVSVLVQETVEDIFGMLNSGGD